MLRLLPLAVAAAAWAADSDELFEKRVRPVFVAKCQGCHSGKEPRAGLDLTSGAGFTRGADSGPVVDTTNPEESRLLRAIGYLDRIKMPPTGRLADAEVQAVTEWVRAGARWPGAQAPQTAATAKTGYSRAQKSFWSFQPLRRANPPAVKNTAWPRTPVDHFLLAKLEEKGLSPASEADRLTFLRRATFDLTGLPPSEKEIRDFLADQSAEAYGRVIERLLASPR